MGRHQSHVQVLRDGPKGALHHQRHRKPEQRLPTPQPQPQRLSERYEPAEGAVPGHLRIDKKVNHAGAELGRGLRRAGDHVSREIAGRVGVCRFDRRPP